MRIYALGRCTVNQFQVRRGKQDKDARQAAFIEAAMAVFAEKGFDAATTREIAERAGCSEGLIHRYFGGKRGLLLAILRRKSERARDLVREGVPDSDSLHDEVRAIMLWSLDFMWEQRDFMRVTSCQGIVDPEIGRFIGSGLHAERARVIAEKLLRHRDAGRIRDDVDLDAVAQTISGMTYQSGFFLQVVFEMDHQEVRRIVREVARVMIRGIASDAELARMSGG